MRIAVLGGSFNPVHIGHLILADEVCVSLGYDKVLFVPAFIPPHKQMSDTLPAHERMRMVELACFDDPRFEMEPCEIMRGGISYTYDTICWLEKKYEPSDKIGLILGKDLFPSFHLWKNAEEIAERCSLILADRPFREENKRFANHATGGYSDFEGPVSETFDIKKEPLFRNAVVLDNEPVAVSSTDIRARIFQKMAFQYLVPSKVFNYIMNGNLYGRKN